LHLLNTVFAEQDSTQADADLDQVLTMSMYLNYILSGVLQLFQDDGDKSEQVETRTRDTEFNFRQYEEKFAHFRIVENYCLVC
jgi:hypothetical protein